MAALHEHSKTVTSTHLIPRNAARWRLDRLRTSSRPKKLIPREVRRTAGSKESDDSRPVHESQSPSRRPCPWTSEGHRQTNNGVVGCGDLFVSEGGDAPIELVSDRQRFFAKIRDYQHEPELFIDIETADWWTPTPRVALLQVWAGREVAVFDVLAPGMREVLSDCFVPYVMANQRIRKWAHSASYERRFLGGARVQNLECTLRLARGIAFHRLPTETLSLASLASALFGVTLDKTFQKADWAVRPLSQEHLRYAADDTVWCARVADGARGDRAAASTRSR